MAVFFSCVNLFVLFIYIPYICDNSQGKVLLWRDYRGDVPLNIAERFMNIIMAKDEQDVRPIFEEDGVTYIYVKYKNLYSTCPHLLASSTLLSVNPALQTVMTVTKHNADAAMLLIFLYKLIQVLPHNRKNNIVASYHQVA
jgi:AP-1 complex subunit mu